MAQDAAAAVNQTEPEAADHVLETLAVFARATARALLPTEDDHGNPNLGRFLIENGRLPFVTDAIKPWQYRGWLIPYIQLCEGASDAISPRYDYVLRTHEAGRLLDEPIPQCCFISENAREAKAGMKMLEQMARVVENRSGYSRMQDQPRDLRAMAFDTEGILSSKGNTARARQSGSGATQ